METPEQTYEKLSEEDQKEILAATSVLEKLDTIIKSQHVYKTMFRKRLVKKYYLPVLSQNKHFLNHIKMVALSNGWIASFEDEHGSLTGYDHCIFPNRFLILKENKPWFFKTITKEKQKHPYR